MGWLKDISEEQGGISRLGLIPAYHNFLLYGNKNDEEVGLPEIWKVNGEKNIPWLDKNRDKIDTVYNMPKHENQAIIFVGASPTLYKALPAFKEIDERFVVVATNTSVGILVKNGIIPDYVIAIDGRNRHKTWTLDIPECKDSTAIFSVCTEPDAMKAWPGKIMIVPYGVKDKSLKMKIQHRFGKGVASGGNALNSAVALFILFTHAKIFLFAGNELSFKKRYYAHRKHRNDELAYFFATNIYGERVKTFIPLYEYKVWLENVMAQLYPEYYFCNCSEGILGVDVDDSLLPFICHKPLDYAIAEIKDACDMEKKSIQEKLKYLYDEFYDHDLGNLQRGKGIWKYVIKCFSFKKGIDIGCGRANGVEYARSKGYDVYGSDISSGAMKCWKERGVTEFCQVCPANKMPYQDDEFDFVVCSEVMEHIPEDDIDSSLGEIFRVGSDKFLFTIALKPENIPLGGFIQSHITIKAPEWWFQRFYENGYKIVAAAHDIKMTGITILAVKSEQPYIEGGSKLPLWDKENIGLVVFGHTEKPVPEFWEEGL